MRHQRIFMKSLSRSPGITFLLTLGLAALACRGGSVQAPYQVGTWSGFRPAAVSFTFDDDCANQYAIAEPLFTSNGLRMTLFTVTSWEGSWPLVKRAAADGHEIASHTVTHPTLSGLTLAQQTNELLNSQMTINANVTNARCLTLAYPNCVEANEAVTGTYYFAARGCSGQIVPPAIGNFLNISSFVCGQLGSVQTLQNFTNLANSAVGNNGWCVYLIHGIDNDGGYSPLPSSVLISTAQYFATNQNRYWVDTFCNVARYAKERINSTLLETATGTTSLTVQITNALDNSIFNGPLTVRRPLPSGWPMAAATQNGRDLGAQTVNVTGTNYVMFDVVPNTGNVILTETAQPPAISVAAMTSPGSLTFRLDGQTGVTYMIDSSGDLLNWAPVLTNALAATYTNLTIPLPDAMRFYRARWTP